MRIQLKQLTIVNFKGIQHFEVCFNHITSIWGDNATGKTTVFDAFLWLFFGKNSEDVSQFEIKRLDQSNKFIKDLEAEVSAILNIDGQEIAVKKVLRQKWIKRRGEPLPNYSGDENVYYWNDVPLKEMEFKAKIKGIVDENLFKLITNPFYFNSLKWQDRRNILIDIAGSISNTEVFDSIITASNKNQYSSLINALNAGKTIDEFKRELSAKKKKVKDEADNIPSRIDEVRRGMPQEYDFDELRENLKSAEHDLATLQGTLNDEVAQQKEEGKTRADALKEYNQKVQARQQKIFDIKTKMQNIEFGVKQQARDAGGKLDAEIISVTRQTTDKQLDIDRYNKSVSGFEQQVKEKNAAVEDLRHKYADIDAKEISFDFNSHEFICPACKQALSQTDIESKKEELTANFNSDKRTRLDEIIKNATSIKEEITGLNTRIDNGRTIILGLNDELNILKVRSAELKQQALQPKEPIEKTVADLLYNHAEYKQLVEDLAETEAIKLIEPVFPPQQTNDEIKNKQSSINLVIEELKKQLHNEELRQKAQGRIAELESQENVLSQQLADLEGTEFAIMQFTKAKIDATEKRINAKFDTVKFKMFDTQVNGGEVECCDTLVPGPFGLVPFSDANNGARINAGIDIINSLCSHYNVYAPIFIDNRESVTRLIDSDSQIVNLIVSEQDKKLRVA